MSKWICDMGRSVDMRVYPDCTWKCGGKCTALKKHSHDKHCEGSFCLRAGVYRQCHEVVPVSRKMEEAVAAFIKE